MMQAYDTLSINEAFAKEKLLRKYPFYEEGIIQLCVCYSEEGEPIGCAELYLDHDTGQVRFALQSQERESPARDGRIEC